MRACGHLCAGGNNRVRRKFITLELEPDRRVVDRLDGQVFLGGFFHGNVPFRRGL